MCLTPVVHALIRSNAASAAGVGSGVAQFPYRLAAADAVAPLVAAVRGDEDVTAGCLVCVGAHGFSMEIELLQRREGDVRYSSWNDVQGNISVEDRVFDLDVSALVAAARPLAGTTIAGSGRRVLVVLADASGGFWIDAPESGVPELAALYAVVFR